MTDPPFVGYDPVGVKDVQGEWIDAMHEAVMTYFHSTGNNRGRLQEPWINERYNDYMKCSLNWKCKTGFGNPVIEDVLWDYGFMNMDSMRLQYDAWWPLALAKDGLLVELNNHYSTQGCYNIR